MIGELGFNDFSAAHQRHAQGIRACLPSRARVAYAVAGWIANACRRLLGFDFYDFASLIVTAFRADAVRHFFLMAVRTLRERVCGQEIVRATLGGARFGMTPFRIRHCLPQWIAAFGTR